MRLKIYQFLGVLFFALMLTGSAWAAGAGLAPTPKAAVSAAEEAGVSVKDLEDLAGTLKDEAKRKALLARIQALIAVQKGAEKPAEKSSPGAAFIGMLTNHVEKMTGQLLSMAEALSDLPELKNWLLDQITSEKARDLWIGLLIKVGIALGVGIGGEYLTRFLLTRPRRAVASWKIKSYLMRIPALGARTLLDIIPVAVFAGMAYATLPLTEPDPKVNVVALIIINAYAIARVVMALVRMVLVPANETLRLLPLSGETANYLFIWARRLVYTTVYGYFFAEASLLLGLPPAGHTGLLRLLGLLIAGMVIVLINQNRSDVAKLIRGKPKDDELLAQIRNLRTRLAKSWHLLASLYVAVVFGVWAFGVLGGFQFLLKATIVTGVILFAARYAAIGIRKGVEKGFAVSDEVKERFPTLEARANRYVPVLHTTLRWILYAAVTVFLLQTWGVDIVGLLKTPAGKSISNAAISIFTTLVLALVFWELLSSAFERYLGETDHTGELVERSARIRTLLPLLRNVILVLLVTTVILTVLSEVGVNIAPLLAGAGVIGLAIGFGAQTLVKDIITGAFILFENTIAVGDVVALGSHTGRVEKITIRSIQLRDFSGSVHTIPFSSVETVTNRTKDFSYAVFEVGVGYGEDTDEVTRILHDIGAEMENDEELGPLILEPLEVVGVDQFADSAVVIKARMKTQPVKQWSIKREFNRRMKIKFDELGIEIPYPHTTLFFGENKSGTAPPARFESTPKNKTEKKPTKRPTGKNDKAENVDMPAAVDDDGE